MGRVRTTLRANPWLAAAALLAALALRVLAPAGYMPSFESHSIEVLVCHGAGGSTSSVRLDLPTSPAGEDPAERCAFADLSVPWVPAADPFLAALALAFVLALWLTFSRALPARLVPHLRPPLRGPPAAA